jgi:hypothetical protein
MKLKHYQYADGQHKGRGNISCLYALRLLINGHADVTAYSCED